jgi:hypothetical protein
MLAISKASLFPQQTSLSHPKTCLKHGTFFRHIPYTIKNFSTQTISPFKSKGEKKKNTRFTVPQAQPDANNASALLHLI